MKSNPILVTLFLLALSSLQVVKAQELNCQISVTSRQVEGTDRQIYNSLQTALYEFMNNRKWSSYSFTIDERIECTMMFTISDRVSVDQFKGTLNVVLRRPVYKSSYYSPLLNHIDRDIEFKYIEFESLEFNDNSFISELTGLLAYYANIAIGLDFDSFQLMGGTPFFEKAMNIVNMAQSSAFTGWKAFEGTKNRYWLAENFTNSSYSKLREFLYNYHRLGLDVMSENVDGGRQAITESLELLRQAYRDKPNSYLLQLILDSKRDEFINVYSGAPDNEKVTVVNLLKEIDPANGSKYQKILEK